MHKCKCISIHPAIIQVYFQHMHDDRPGACTMMVDEQIQSYRISFEFTKPNHSNPALLVPWCWSSTFFVNSGFNPEFVEHVHMNVWHHWQTANHEPRLKVLLKDKRLKNMMNLNAFTIEKSMKEDK